MIMKKYRLKKKIINYAYVANPEDRLKTEDGKKHLIPPMECSNLHWVDYYGIPEWLLNEDKYFELVEDRIELNYVIAHGKIEFLIKNHTNKQIEELINLVDQATNDELFTKEDVIDFCMSLCSDEERNNANMMWNRNALFNLLNEWQKPQK